METTSALPLPENTLFAMVKEEYVPYLEFAFAEPENEAFSSYTTLALGYGISSWLSVWLFQPFAVKAQDSLGRSAGPGDTGLALSLGLKWDDGPRLVPPKDTWLASASVQYFFPYRAPSARYQFGAEGRLDTALVFQALSRDSFRLDLAAELNGLSLGRDREEDVTGELRPLTASGGSTLYAGLGARLFLGRVSLAVGVRRAVLGDLNEESEQQGSEGLERFRGTVVLSWSGEP
jgi:hypothetical protein